MAWLRQLPSLQLLCKGVQRIECRVSLFPFGQFCHRKAKGIMKVGVQSMVEAVLLQISPTIRKVLLVRMADYCDCIMYAEHVLLHCLVLFLLNLIQHPYHGIIFAFVTKHLHMHQQILHGDIFAFIQGVGPFTWVPMETSKDMGAHTGLIILLKEDIHIKMPECVRHFRTWISQLENWHIQSCRSQLLLLPTPSAAPVMALQPCLQWSNHQSPVLPYLLRKEVNLPH